MATALPAQGGISSSSTSSSGRHKEKQKTQHLHLHIGRSKSPTCDALEDSGIGLEEGLMTKVLATPPTGKRKGMMNVASSPKSAPASAGPSGADLLSSHMAMASLSATSSSSFSATSRNVIHMERGRSPQKQQQQHDIASAAVTGSPSPTLQPRGQHAHTPSSNHHGSHGSSGIFTALKETVTRTVSLSPSSSSSHGFASVSKSSAPDGGSLQQSKGGTANFLVGSDSEEEEGGSTASGGGGSGSGTGSSASSRRSSQKSTHSSSGTGSRGEAKGKSRFRRMLNPLRRSHSAGCDQDVPAHALFLKHQAELEHSKKPLSSSHRSVDKCSSSSSGGPDAGHRQGSDSETEDADKKHSANKSKSKSLARDLKDKMAFLRRRHTDTALASKVPDPKRPSAEGVASWSRDLEHLLHDKVGLQLFREFLQSEFSDENLEFWIACEEYKGLKDSKMVLQAQKIFVDFVAIQAPREINLDSKTRMACKEAMSHPNRHTFEQCQKRIQGLMEKDSYPRFLKSEAYQELCAELKVNIHSS